jgi:hypothetical protein
MNLGAVQNHPRSVTTAKLLTYASDQDGDSLSITAVIGSTNGAAVTLTTTNVTYTPVTNFMGTDAFNYTVSDSRGATATGLVIVQVTSESDPSLNRIGSLTVSLNGVKMRFVGIPGSTYAVQRCADLTNWSSIGTLTVPENGIAEYTDTNPPPGRSFYRTLSQ